MAMDVFRRFVWWSMTYGALGCLWLTAELQAELGSQPEAADGSAPAAVSYESVDSTLCAASELGPADHTLAAAPPAESFAESD
jgi:hypothetical protein